MVVTDLVSRPFLTLGEVEGQWRCLEKKKEQ